MPEIFQIEIFGSQTSSERVPIFYPGQNVHARVVLHLLESMNAKSIDLHISGKAEVYWTKSGSDNKTDHYRSEAIYLNQNIQLWAPPDRQIPPNIEHIFPFQFTVPPNCPPSFGEIGSKGRIHYSCSARINSIYDNCGRNDMVPMVAKSIFIISSFVDLNTFEWALSPVKEYNKIYHQSIGCCFWKYGKIKAEVQLPKSGFVPGEWIPFSIKIDNKTTKQVKKVKAKLLQNAIYVAKKGKILRYDFTGTTNCIIDYDSEFQSIPYSKCLTVANHTKREQKFRKIAEMEEQFMLDPGLIRTFQGHLAVPPCTPSFNNCPVIRLGYSLEVNRVVGLSKSEICPEVTVVTTSFCCGSRCVELPLLIGTIPIHDQQEYPNLLNPSSTQPNAASSPFSDNFIPSRSPPYSCYSEHPLPLPTNKEIYLEQLKHR